MSKNILIISSSLSNTKNTLKLCEQFKKGAEDAQNSVELIELKGKKLNYCLGCNTCQKNGGTCVYKDDAPEIIAKMIKADIIVLTSPIYFYSVTGQMKTLIDRCYAKLDSLGGKEFYYILTCNAPYNEEYKADLDIAVETFRGFIKCLPSATEKAIIIGDNMESIEIEKSVAYQDAYNIGKSIF